MFCATKHLFSVCFVVPLRIFKQDHNEHINRHYVSKTNMAISFVLLLNACYILYDILCGLENSLHNGIELKIKLFNICNCLNFIFGILTFAPKSKHILINCQATTQLLTTSYLFGAPLLQYKQYKAIANLSKNFRRIICCIFIYFLILTCLDFNFTKFHYNVVLSVFGIYCYVFLFFHMTLCFKTTTFLIKNLKVHLKCSNEENNLKLLSRLYMGIQLNLLHLFAAYRNFIFCLLPVVTTILVIFVALLADIFILKEDWQIYSKELIILFSSCAICSSVSFSSLYICHVNVSEVSLASENFLFCSHFL